MNITTDKEKLSSDYIAKHLSLLENLVDVEYVKQVEQKQLDVFSFKPVDRLPVLVSLRDDVAHLSLGSSEWPSFTFDHMWNDYGAMLLNELQPAYESATLKDDKVFTVRPNLSMIIVPSMFGAEATFFAMGPDSMPSVHKPPTKEKLLEILHRKIDIANHWAIIKYKEVIDCWRELLAPYDKLKEVVHFSLPDLQGPFNVYFMLRGADAYMDLYDSGDFAHELMKYITDVLIETTNHLSDCICRKDIAYYWNYIYPGRIRNVDDNSILISKEQYVEYILPYNQALLKECGGGIHHYCGQGDHVIDDIMAMDGNRGLNFGNPELQDFDTVLEKANANKVVLLWDKEIDCEKFRKLNQAVIMKIITTDMQKARDIIKRFKQ